MKILRTDGTVEWRAFVCDLATLQREVGGNIGFFAFADGSALLVNEGGKQHNLMFNDVASDLVIRKGRPEIIVGDAIYFTAAEMALDWWLGVA